VGPKYKGVQPILSARSNVLRLIGARTLPIAGVEVSVRSGPLLPPAPRKRSARAGDASALPSTDDGALSGLYSAWATRAPALLSLRGVAGASYKAAAHRGATAANATSTAGAAVAVLRVLASLIARRGWRRCRAVCATGPRRCMHVSPCRVQSAALAVRFDPPAASLPLPCSPLPSCGGGPPTAMTSVGDRVGTPPRVVHRADRSGGSRIVDMAAHRAHHAPHRDER